MPPDPHLLRRNPYLIPPSTELAHSGRTHYEDWEEYHLPLVRTQNAYLHDWGIAGGLEVDVNPANPTEIEIKPGVAVDSAGELIVLAPNGHVDTGGDQPLAAPFRLSTQGIADAIHYLVILYGERLNFTDEKQEQLPKLRLVSTTGDGGYTHDGVAIILAIVQTDAAGNATVRDQIIDLPYRRRHLGSHTEQLELRRSSLSITGAVGATVAGRIAAQADGLRITVAGAADRVAFMREDGGTFNEFKIGAEQAHVQGDLRIDGNLHTEGNIGVGVQTPIAKLQVVNAPQDADGYTLVLGTTNASNLRLGYHSDYSWIQSHMGKPLTINPLGNNVGIWTTTPRATLDVNGDLRLLNGAAVNEFSTDETLRDNSHAAIPTERAVKEYVDNLLVGCVAAFASPEAPSGWLECNGQAIGRTEFARLFARIGTAFGAGNGSTTFNVPDLRGLLIRGWDHGSGIDSGRSFGSYQADAFQDHKHYFYGIYSTISGGWHDHVVHTGGFWSSVKLSGGGSYAIRRHDEGHRSWGESHSHGYTPSGSISGAVSGSRANETRPKNRALMYCIKF
jgi:hypothetical protein